MATRGRKPKAAHLKVLAGDRPGRGGGPAPSAPVGAPEPPSFLAGAGLDEWGRLVAELRALGILSTADRGILTLAAGAYGRWLDAEAKLGTELTIMTRLGGVKQSPLIGIAAAARSEYLKCLSELGLTPASRSRIKAPEPKSEDQLGEFLSRSRRSS